MRSLRPRSWSRATSTGAALLGVLFVFGCADQANQPTSPDGDLSAAFGEPGPPQELGPALAAQRAHSDRLMGLRDVVGTGVGIDDGGEASVVVYLTRPGAAGVPERLDDVPVERIVTGLITAGAEPTTRQRPAPVGFSVGHPDITAGTYGARVTDGSSTFMLSNNHVLANSNDASIGDATLQPGPTDGGTDPDDRIAELADFEPIDFENDNVMDAAIAAPLEPDSISASTPEDAYGAPSSTPVTLDGDGDGLVDDGVLGLAVQKYGRTTGLTTGEVSEINVTVNVCYETRGPFMCAQAATFVDQIGITPGDFSGGGDSGSLIVTNDLDANPVGLLYAGSSTRTLANRIDLVLEHFAVTVDDGSGEDGGGEETDDPPTVSITNPSDGATVSGTVTIEADASDDNGVNQVEFFVDDSSVGVDLDGNDGWSTSWDSNNVSDGDRTITADATDTADQTTSSEPITVTVDNTTDDGGEDATGMHVGDLDGTSVNNGRTWDAVVTVAVHDANGDPVEGAQVGGTWTGTEGGTPDSSTCTTDSTGQCSVSALEMRKNNGTVTYTVDGVTHDDTSLTYTPGDNHDPDGDSDGTTITVSK